MKNYITNIREALKKEAVLCIAAAAAALTMFFVPPSAKYIGYIDFRVLSLLFCLMAVVAGFQKTGLFIFLSEKLLKKVSDSRSLSYVLIMLCFFTSMWITNDVALITFVPFAIMILTVAGKSKLLIPVVVLQTIAANLGSMLTPVGNPQNLYLYSTYDIPVKEFLMITLPVTALSFVLLSLATLLIKKESLEVSLEYTSGINVLIQKFKYRIQLRINPYLTKYPIRRIRY
ncbi:MAG TPA: SLC13 family permease [Mobilitalea sp.]|nr:SLC13 family permease [Mobilitalea sp.]